MEDGGGSTNGPDWHRLAHRQYLALRNSPSPFRYVEARTWYQSLLNVRQVFRNQQREFRFGCELFAGRNRATEPQDNAEHLLIVYEPRGRSVDGTRRRLLPTILARRQPSDTSKSNSLEH